MSIRIKLILVYLLMVFLSAILLSFFSMSIFTNYFMQVRDTVFKDMTLEESIAEVIDIMTDIKVAEKYDEEKLIDYKYIEELNEKLQVFDMHLLVLYDDQWIDVSSADFDQSFYKQLTKQNSTKFKPHPHSEENDPIYFNEKQYFPFSTSFLVNQKNAEYFFIVDTSNIEQIKTNYVSIFFTFLLIILMIVTLPLIYILSKHIVKPLKNLELGANKIREGDLDYIIEASTNDEIGRVTTSFNKMRIELKKSIEQQLEYEENRKELISCISHDLMTPITSIKGYVEGIQDGVANDKEKLDKYLEVIYRKSQDMEKMINDLAIFSKLDLNHLPMYMEKVNIKKFIFDCIDELSLEYQKQAIKISSNIEVEDYIMVLMDQQNIKRVIMNIVQNAVRFMDKEEKLLKIYLNAENGRSLPIHGHRDTSPSVGVDIVNIYITDNGRGIEASKLPYIFDKFYRVDEARNTEQGGSGLGLAISKQIIEKHGGTISAQSQEGKGTTIHFTLKKYKIETKS